MHFILQTVSYVVKCIMHKLFLKLPSDKSCTKRHNFHRLSNIVYNRYVQHNLAWIAFYRVSLYNPPLLPHAVLP